MFLEEINHIILHLISNTKQMLLLTYWDVYSDMIPLSVNTSEDTYIGGQVRSGQVRSTF